MFFNAIFIDAHRLKSRGWGTWCFLPKSLGGGGGVKAFRKNSFPYFGFYCISINKCFEIYLRGDYIYPSPHPSPCASMAIFAKFNCQYCKKARQVVCQNDRLTDRLAGCFSANICPIKPCCLVYKKVTKNSNIAFFSLCINLLKFLHVC